MRRFEEEILNEYPDWVNPTETLVKRRVVKKITIKPPRYVLPMILTMLLLGVYAALMHMKTKEMYWYNNVALSHLEQQVIETNEQVATNRDAVNLVAILHNENFASVRQVTGNQNLIFINQDWTINDMPQFLNMTDEMKEKVANKWLKDLN